MTLGDALLFCKKKYAVKIRVIRLIRVLITLLRQLPGVVGGKSFHDCSGNPETRAKRWQETWRICMLHNISLFSIILKCFITFAGTI